ncbi:MAG TPA: amidohydrolase family protein, partial [Arenibacter sp.]|nr:amidohydrolase family protein [Arenibacter sp.]
MKKNILFLSLAILFACSGPKENVGPTAILISNVNILDVSDGRINENMQVVIDSGIIKKITKVIDAAEKYPVQIDGKGQFLIPGLAEMHAHIPEPPTPQQRIEETLFLYLSNGVTTIRGMLGHPSQLELRERAKDGSLLSPRIIVSSPSFNGHTATTKEQAINLVNQYKNEGYDFLKIHPGVSLEAFDQLVQTAREVNIPFAGHVPVEVGIRHALKSKYASIDHVDGYLEGLVPDSEGVAPSDNGFFGYNFTSLADTAQIDELVRLSKENEVWVVPTQSLFERWFAPIASDELMQQPEMKYMPTSILENWKNGKDRMTGPNSNFNKVQWEEFITIRKQLIRKLQDGGHGLLLGSDAPQIFNVPG